MAQESNKQDNSNQFILNKQYPDLKSILKRSALSTKNLSKDAIFVIDANALLAPYYTEKKNIEEIRKVYSKLVKDDKLYVPAHALREFIKNRSGKISDLYVSIDKQLSNIPSVNKLDYPILDELDAYKNFNQLIDELKDQIKKYKSYLQELRSNISNWNWADPVTTMYSNTFDEETIIDVNTSEEELLQEYSYRIKNNIPPGNRDKGKEENAIGDFLIWKTILELGLSKNKDIIFVSNDEKNDWLVKGNTKSISTRFELVDEFNRYSNGNNFACMTFSDFLELQGIDVEFKSFERAYTYHEEAFRINERLTGSSRLASPPASFFDAIRIVNDILSNYIKDVDEELELSSIIDPNFEMCFKRIISSDYDEFVGDLGEHLPSLAKHYSKLRSTLLQIYSYNDRIYFNNNNRITQPTILKSNFIKAISEFINEYSLLSRLRSAE